MVTNYPQVLVTTDRNVRTEARLTLVGMMESAVRRVGQIACAVRGHEMLWHYERERVMLECGRCGHASKGWDVSGTAAPRDRVGGALTGLGRRPSNEPPASCQAERRVADIFSGDSSWRRASPA